MRSVQKWIATFDELHRIVEVSLEQAINEASDGDEKPQRIVSRVSDDLLAFLIDAYELGCKSAGEMLGIESDSITPDVKRMRETIYKTIEGKTFEDRVRDHVVKNDPNGLKTLAESEYHRVFADAQQTTAEGIADSKKLSVTKTWRTQGDERVRDTHEYLENMQVQLNDRFYTYDGDSALTPGGFKNVENNANCRCWLEFTGRESW